MFLLDPGEGLSREELLQNIFHVRFTPAHRAKLLEIATARGCTWLDVLREYAEEHNAMMADPIQREAWLRTSGEMDRQRAMPFGPDPLRDGKERNP